MPSTPNRKRPDAVKFRSAPAEPSLRSRPARGHRATPPARAPARGAEGRAEAPDAGARSPEPARRVPIWKQVERDEQRTVGYRLRRRAGADRSALPPRGYAVVYDLDGPRCTVGVVWFAAVLAALALGVGALAVLYGALAALAGYQLASVWRTKLQEPEPIVAAAGAAVISLAVLLGLRTVGGAVLLLVVASLVAARLSARSETSVLDVASLTAAAGLFPGLVAVGVALTYHYEIGAAVTLVLLVSAYECGDYLVGSGASNRVEGPAAGVVALAVVALALGVLHIPPFRGVGMVPFAIVAAIGCPLGQLFGSLLLPDAGVRARALRRLDSLLVLAPTWAWLIGLYVA